MKTHTRLMIRVLVVVIICQTISMSIVGQSRINPQVPSGTIEGGSIYLPPGIYPDRLTSANVDISLPPETILGGAGSNDMKVKFPSMGPIDWTDARHNEGDIAFNIGAAQPGISAPDEFREHKPGGGDLIDGTTFAWTVDNRHGVGFATTRTNGFDNLDRFENGDLVGIQYGVSYFSHQFRSGFGYSPIDGVFGNANFSSDTLLGIVGEPSEGVFDIAISFFPYVEGWTAGQISGQIVEDELATELPVIFYNAENGGSIGYGVDPELIYWVDANDDFQFNEGLALLGLPQVDDAEMDGMLFVAPAHDSSNTKIAGATPDGDVWNVTIRDDRTIVNSSDNSFPLAPRDQSAFSFLFLPWDTENLVGGYIQGNNGESIKDAGNFTLSRIGDGQYELTIPNKSGDDGVLILSNAGSIEGSFYKEASPAFLSYQYSTENGAFIIESNQLEQSGIEPVDTNFYFAWIDFENPITPKRSESPKIIKSIPFGDSYFLDPSDPNTFIQNRFAGLAINTHEPEILVTTVFNSYSQIDPTNDLGYLFDPETDDGNNGVLIGYRISSISGNRIGDPFIILGNPKGEIQKNEVKYNPVSRQYIVVAESRGISANGLNIPVIALVSSNQQVIDGAENVVKIIKHDDDAADHQFQDVGLAVSSENGNFMIVAEYQQQGVGEGVSGAIYDKEGNLVSKVVNRLDTIAQDRDEDDPDVSYLPKADLFLFTTNIDPEENQPNRITLTAIETSPNENGDFISGNQQIVSQTRVEGTSQGHPSVIENPFNGEVIVAFDYGNGSAGGDLVYLSINEDKSFTASKDQIPYLEAAGNDPFNHRHPQIAVNPREEIMILAHNANGGNSYPGIFGMAYTLLDKDGDIIPGRSEDYFGFHGFSKTQSPIDNGANFHNIKFDPSSGKFYVVVNDQSGNTRLIGLVISQEPGNMFVQNNLVELISQTPELSQLVQLVELSGLADSLSGDGPFTVFAPVNSGFENLDSKLLDNLTSNIESQLVPLLSLHAVNGMIRSSDLVSGQSITSINGQELKITQDGSNTWRVNDTKIIATGLVGKNGIIHLIEDVLIPSEPDFEITISKGDESNLVIEYKGTLQTSENINGPWIEVSGASSPYAVSPENNFQFFRVVE